ncbi:hypothetical protein ARMGADRAFT_988222 [Armillaria gallica]|uniref:Uncharacterized protein n=1 Tax=Armillaria gallica TaxID=47427 RepID=A0A2H3E770_ARMGA|nr:hypothetical protein ARMGADRAFT_988222 [Armillaria gallica]
MIIEEKCMYPSPPPYNNLSPPPPFTPSVTLPKSKPTLGSLPPHLSLQIVYCTFPQRDGKYEGEGKIERQRMNLHWLVTSLRLVNKTLYIACMHILRSTYLPAYDSLIRAPYTSDPFPSSSMPQAEKSSIFSTHRELSTLDLFIALLAHEDLMLDSTSLHLPREEAYKDLFDMVQPKTRLEDLVIEEGVKAGVIQIDPPIPPPRPQRTVHPIPSDYLSISFTPRKVALVYTQPSTNASRKTIVEVVRNNRDEPLETCAANLVAALGEWLEEE